jgi:hypothetical protein
VRYVPPPSLAPLPTLAQIEASVTAPLRAAIVSVRQRIQGAYAAFDLATPTTLHTLPRIALPAGARTALHTIFKRRSGQFRDLLDGLTSHFEETGDGTCPYCNFGEQWEHDHYLPRSVFPEFTLYPKNLVPICKSCNGKKLASYQSNGDRLFLHLFSELRGITGLLQVAIVYDPRVRISYTLVKPNAMSQAEFAVLGRHFDRLNLADRYARQASATVARLIKEFRKQQNLDLGRNRLRRRLRRMAQDRAAQTPPNHWESALLEYLAASPDFTDYVFT